MGPSLHIKKYNQPLRHKGFGVNHVFIICNFKLEHKLHNMKQNYPLHLDTILGQYYSLPLFLYLNKKSLMGPKAIAYRSGFLTNS